MSHQRTEPRNPAGVLGGTTLLLGLLATAMSCSGSDGSQGPTGPQGPPPPPPPMATSFLRGQGIPNLSVGILGIDGGSGPGGALEPGDAVTVDFRIDQDDGSPWALGDLVDAEILVSGPTVNYQRVLPLRDDVATRSVFNTDGSYSYTFDVPLPGVYAAPYNDSPDFGPLDGELTGDALLAGTYTVGLSVSWAFDVEGYPGLRVGEATHDFLVGAAAGLEARAVSGLQNCNQCHQRLEAHDGRYRELGMCLLCHTSGAEDANDPAVGGGTPGVSIDSRVMFHRIHNASHLPSVNGVDSFPDGSRNYAATPEQLLFARPDGTLRDLSTIGFPAFPNRALAMPKDGGHGLLSASQQAQEEQVRRGVTSCFVCHGDPDGTGPATAPDQGGLIETQLTRRACGSCHDDVHFEDGYSANFQIMPPQLDDSGCLVCHIGPSGPLSVADGHKHPLRDPFFDTGLNIELQDVREAGTHNGDGTFDPGEKVELVLRFSDDSGGNENPKNLDEVGFVLSGPTGNLNLLHAGTLEDPSFDPPQPFTLRLSDRRHLEFVGDATSAPGETFATGTKPHLVDAGTPTNVSIRTGLSGVGSTLSDDARRGQNFIDVQSATGFARDDIIVLDDGIAGREEYLRVQHVSGKRLWFSSLADRGTSISLSLTHDTGATVQVAQTLALTSGVHYSVDDINGTVTEIAEFGDGNAVLVSYLTEWTVPASYPAPFHASPDLGEDTGAWEGAPLVDGTYRLALFAHDNRDWFVAGESNAYPLTSDPVTADLLFGSAATVEPYDVIESGSACQACHQDLSHHDGKYRGFDTCITCHGTAGAEDLPRYVAANAPGTPGVTTSFRSLIHSIHRGRSLDALANFQVIGRGAQAHPDNFEINTYEHIAFPAWPNGTGECAVCHGDANTTWKQPEVREHPILPLDPVRSWSVACTGCHDSTAAQAHVDANTAPSGAESCNICHAPGEFWEVEWSHRRR